MKKIIMLLMMIGLVTITVACGNGDQAEENNGETPTAEEAPDGEGQSIEDTVSEDELVDEDQAVATINGEEISGTSFNTMYPLVKSTLQQYGQDVEDTEEVKEQTLNELITQELIRQDAEAEGLTVEQEEIDNEMAALEEQYGDQFDSVLETSGFTKETYRAQLERDLLSNKYMESVLGIEVTDEEIEEYYQSVSEQSEEDLPSLEEVEGDIRQQLSMQKQQENQDDIQAKIEELRENADIEELI